MIKRCIKLSGSKILDNIEEIKRIDRENMLSHCLKAPQYCREAVKLTEKISVNYSKPKRIIVAGMGGSAIGGEILKDWAFNKLSIPVEVCRAYSLPAYANRETLVFVITYSGETEEALSMLLDALKKKCMIFFISSNDKNLALAEKLEVPCIKVSSGIPPRAALPYLSLPMFKILEKLNLISKVDEEIDETIKILKHVCAENSPEKPLKNNFSKSLALKINGTIPIVYGFGIYRAVAQRYKQQFNENSKIPSGWDFFPELNHNEIMGWEKAGKLAEDFSLILIRDKNEPDYLRLRIEVTKELMPEELREKTFEVFSQGASELAKMFSTIYIGDFTSVYLAILRGVDPTPVKSISMLKEKITVSGVKNQIIKEFENL